MSDHRPPKHLKSGLPGLPSTETWEEHNRTSAAAGRARAIARLTCQHRGCTESLAFLELDPDSTAPILRLAIRAPWTNESRDDRAILHRLRLRGATDPTADAVYLAVPRMREGERVEFLCRHGHESRFGRGHLAQRLRGVLP